VAAADRYCGERATWTTRVCSGVSRRENSQVHTRRIQRFSSSVAGKRTEETSAAVRRNAARSPPARPGRRPHGAYRKTYPPLLLGHERDCRRHRSPGHQGRT
jgi:hypothetical protein